jgi:hypothetical protein
MIQNCPYYGTNSTRFLRIASGNKKIAQKKLPGRNESAFYYI